MIIVTSTLFGLVVGQFIGLVALQQYVKHVYKKEDEVEAEIIKNLPVVKTGDRRWEELWMKS